MKKKRSKKTSIQQVLDLYRKGEITLMKSAELAGISLWGMLEIVRQKKIPMPYTLDDVENDIESARRLQIKRP